MLSFLTVLVSKFFVTLCLEFLCIFFTNRSLLQYIDEELMLRYCNRIFLVYSSWYKYISTNHAWELFRINMFDVCAHALLKRGQFFLWQACHGVMFKVWHDVVVSKWKFSDSGISVVMYCNYLESFIVIGATDKNFCNLNNDSDHFMIRENCTLQLKFKWRPAKCVLIYCK